MNLASIMICLESLNWSLEGQPTLHPVRNPIHIRFGLGTMKSFERNWGSLLGEIATYRSNLILSMDGFDLKYLQPVPNKSHNATQIPIHIIFHDPKLQYLTVGLFQLLLSDIIHPVSPKPITSHWLRSHHMTRSMVQVVYDDSRDTVGQPPASVLM